MPAHPSVTDQKRCPGKTRAKDGPHRFPDASPLCKSPNPVKGVRPHWLSGVHVGLEAIEIINCLVQ